MRRLATMFIAAAMAAGLSCGPAPVGVTEAQYGGPMSGGPPDAGPGPYGGRAGSGPRGRMGPFQSYHGFRIDLGEAQGVIDVPSAIAEVDHQIDIVERSGLSASMLARFRSVPVRVSVAFMGGSHYSGGPEVSIGSLQPGTDRPVLLHEYMHVLEYRSFPGGFRNPTVLRFYEEAQAAGLYEPGSYMMSNPWEFWAVTASCYLNGTVEREPYTRAAIRQRQPDYYAYLARMFGPKSDTASAGHLVRLAARDLDDL